MRKGHWSAHEDAIIIATMNKVTTRACYTRAFKFLMEIGKCYME
jgi:hypothetical protein